MNRAMGIGPTIPRVDRRDFIEGVWPARGKEKARTPAEIASVLVHVRPEKMDEVARNIAALPGSEIYSRSPQGKLVVVIEAGTVGEVGAVLNAISSMPHVVTAALVFHGTDAGRALLQPRDSHE
jgi:periplasmic nitrate reductase NapD